MIEFCTRKAWQAPKSASKETGVWTRSSWDGAEGLLTGCDWLGAGGGL